MTQTVRRLVAALAIASCSTAASAQAPAPPSESVRAMAKLAFLVGSWKGSGSVDYMPGQRAGFTSTEIVAFRLDGLVLTIEGIHFAKIPGAEVGPKVHHAFATVQYDPARGDYRMLATKLDGSVVDARGRMEGDAFVWGFFDPRAGHLRFTIGLAGGKWTETGERSADGQRWTPYFEMVLGKV